MVVVEVHTATGGRASTDPGETAPRAAPPAAGTPRELAGPEPPGGPADHDRGAGVQRRDADAGGGCACHVQSLAARRPPRNGVEMCIGGGACITTRRRHASRRDTVTHHCR